MTSTGDGVELWKNNLDYDEALEEIERSKDEFGGKFWMEVERYDPLHNIPDCDPYFTYYEQ